MRPGPAATARSCPLPPSTGAKAVHGVGVIDARIVGLVEQSMRGGMELRNQRREDEGKGGQHATGRQARHPATTAHGQQHREHKHHQGLGGQGGAEEPSGAGPPSVECEHQGVEGESDGDGVLGMTPDHRHVPQHDSLDHTQTAPVGREPIPKRSARASQAKRAIALRSSTPGAKDQPRRGMRQELGKTLAQARGRR